MESVIALAIVLGLLALFLWVARRALRLESAGVRWLGTGVAVVFALLCLIAGGILVRGLYELNAPRGNPISTLHASASPEQLARAERFARGCAGCHSTREDLPLDGATENMLANPDGSALGVLYPPNLTPGGPLKDWSDGEIIRAIREGVDKDGRALLIMPSENFRYIGDADIQALVAYLRSQPAVQHETPPRSLGLMPTLLVGAGLFPTAAQPPIAQPVIAPAPAPTPDYGEYLVSVTAAGAATARTWRAASRLTSARLRALT